jgi:hypothetical protein
MIVMFFEWWMQGYIVRFGQCSVFLIPINKRQPLEISVVLSRWGRFTVVNSAPIVKKSWNQEKYTLPWPWVDARFLTQFFILFSSNCTFHKYKWPFSGDANDVQKV